MQAKGGIVIIVMYNLLIICDNDYYNFLQLEFQIISFWNFAVYYKFVHYTSDNTKAFSNLKCTVQVKKFKNMFASRKKMKWSFCSYRLKK